MKEFGDKLSSSSTQISDWYDILHVLHDNIILLYLFHISCIFGGGKLQRNLQLLLLGRTKRQMRRIRWHESDFTEFLLLHRKINLPLRNSTSRFLLLFVLFVNYYPQYRTAKEKKSNKRMDITKNNCMATDVIFLFVPTLKNFSMSVILDVINNWSLDSDGTI